MRVPTSETVTYQRPDPGLWPYTGTLLDTVLYPCQGAIWMDQKTPYGQRDCPAELESSWSTKDNRWNTIHFTPPSVNGIEEQGSLFTSGPRPPTRDQIMPFNIVVLENDCCCNGWNLFCCKKWLADALKAKSIFLSKIQNRCDFSCRIALKCFVFCQG